MKFGMPTLVEFNSLEENIKLCEELGLDFIELNFDLPYCLPNRINWKEIKKNTNVEFSVHLSENWEIGEIYEPARDNLIKLIKDAILYYHNEANIKKYNLHLNRGVYFSLPDKKVYIFEKYINDYKTSIKKSLEMLSDFATKEEVEIYFENVKVTDYLLDSFKEVTKYKNLFLTLDIGHDAKDKEKASNYFMQYPDQIRHMHIHDFNGEKNHIELGKGNINIKKYLDFCKKKDIYALIEVKREQELRNSIDYIRKMVK